MHESPSCSGPVKCAGQERDLGSSSHLAKLFDRLVEELLGHTDGGCIESMLCNDVCGSIVPRTMRVNRTDGGSLQGKHEDGITLRSSSLGQFLQRKYCAITKDMA